MTNAGNAAAAFLVRVTCKQECDRFPWQACGGWMKEASVRGVPAGKAHILRRKKAEQPPFPEHYGWKNYEATVDPWQAITESTETDDQASTISSDK